MIGIAQETSDRKMLEYGRICVEVEEFSSINKVIKMQMSGHTFPVTVREEACATKSSFEGMLDQHSVMTSMGGVPVSWDVLLQGEREEALPMRHPPVPCWRMEVSASVELMEASRQILQASMQYMVSWHPMREVILLLAAAKRFRLSGKSEAEERCSRRRSLQFGGKR